MAKEKDKITDITEVGLLENKKPKKHKVSRKTNLKIFASVGAISMAAGLGGIIYSIVSPSSYHNNNPWADAILLDDNITKMINNKLSASLIDATGKPNIDNLSTFVHFVVGEKNGVDTYANALNTQVIQDIFAEKDWIANNMSAVSKMLEGTGASLSGTQIIYKNNLLNLILRPKILTYPYNNGDDKYGLVSINVVDNNRGLFTYKVRFALQLIATDGADYYIDLNKTYDYTYDITQATISNVLTFAQMLNLITNNKISEFVSNYGIKLDTTNEIILNNILSEYYTISNGNSDIIFNEEIKDRDGRAFAPINETVNASSLTLNIKYNVKKFNSLTQFGAAIFNNHSNNYNAFAKVLSNIGVNMPTFENITTGYDLYNKNTNNFVVNTMIDQRVNSYQGYIKELGTDSDNIADNVDYDSVPYDYSKYLWGSEHQIFTNKVLIKFLNINNSNISDSIDRSPTELYYDQQSFTDRSIDFSNFNLLENVNDVIDNLYYNQAVADIDQRLTSKATQIKINLQNYLLNNLNDSHINVKNIINNIDIGVSNNNSNIVGTSVVKQAPINGTIRGNSAKVYQDQVYTFPKIIINVNFYIDKNINQTKEISASYDIPSKTVEDPSGVDKNNINVLQTVNLSKTYTTLDSISTLQNDYQQTVVSTANQWESSNPTGSKNEYPVNTATAQDFRIKLNEVSVGRSNNNNLRVGTYNADITATNDSLNYVGNFRTTTLVTVNKAQIANIVMSSFQADTSWTEQRAYQEIQTQIVNLAKNKGLNFSNNDFSISGISSGSSNKLTEGNKTISITAAGSDNVVSGTTTFNLQVDSIDISKYSGQTTIGTQKIGNSVNTIINMILEKIKNAVQNDGYNISNASQYFSVMIYDSNHIQMNGSELLTTVGSYSFTISVINMGNQYFFGNIVGYFNVKD